MNRLIPTAVALVLSLSASSALADETAPAKDAPAETTKAEEKPADTVILHVDAPTTVTVEREDTGEIVCASPCDKPVPIAGRYRIGRVRQSAPFVLEPTTDGHARLRVKPGMRSPWFWAGTAGLGIGLAAIAVGSVIMVNAYENDKETVGGPAGDGLTDNSYLDNMQLGTVFVVGGILAGIWGGATMISHAGTKVRGNMHKDEAPARGLAPLPTRRVATGTGAPAVMIPLLQGTF